MEFQWFIFKKTIVSKVSEGFHRFPRGGGGLNLFSGVGVKMLISIETYRTYDFLGGSRPYLSSGSAHALIFLEFIAPFYYIE